MSLNAEFFYGMNGMEKETKKIRDPATLSPHQTAVYESLSFARNTKTLYKVHKKIMPESSVRRIIYSLRDEGLVERKPETKKWRQVKLGV